MNVLNVKKLKYDGEESNYWRLKAKKALESIKRQSLVTANLILVRLFIVIWQQLETCLLLGESGERKGEKKMSAMMKIEKGWRTAKMIESLCRLLTRK